MHILENVAKLFLKPMNGQEIRDQNIKLNGQIIIITKDKIV